MTTRVPWIVILLIAMAPGCGADGANSESPDVVEDIDEANMQLSFELSGMMYENQPFTLDVRALTSGGDVVTSFSGEVAFSSSIGVLAPDHLTMEAGVASGEMMLSREGNGLLGATVGDLDGILPITVEVTDWTRDPVDSVLNGGLANSEHWNHGGIHSPAVVAHEGGLELFFSTRDIKSEEGDFTDHVLGRAVSSDGGITWTLEPDEPIWTPEAAGVAGFGTLSVMRDEAGMYWLFHTVHSDEGPLGIRAAKSADGIAWEAAPCLDVAGGFDAFWTQQGVMDPSVVALGDGLFRMYFSVRRIEGAVETRDLGAVEGSCADGWGGVQEVLSHGEQGSWDAGWVSQAHVWREQNLWRMLYVGAASDSGSAKSSIGYASSEDGWTWVRAGTNPVIQKESGFWEVHGVGGASTTVMADGSRGVFYTGYPSDKRPRVIRRMPSSPPLNGAN
jgi:hypothetical protein